MTEKKRVARKRPHWAAPQAEATRAREYPRLAAIASIVRLEQGLYALEIGGTPALPNHISGTALPVTQVTVPPGRANSRVEIIGVSGEPGWWIGQDGGTVIVKSPAGGGDVWVTAYGFPDYPMVAPELELHRLDRPGSNGTARGLLSIVAEPEEVQTEILLHVEQLGDRRFSGRGWIGNRGRKLRIEAFSIRPTETLTPADVEIKGLGPSGRETPWVSDGKLCGTRGQYLPLTGFAVRLAAHVRDRFDVLYEGAFFESGVVGPHRNGEFCLPVIADDPLEAINIRVLRRAAS